MRPSLGLAALAMAIALPAHATDNTLAAAPERPTMQAIHARAEACEDQACPVRSGQFDRMAYWVARGNRMAIRLSFSAGRLLDPSSDNARALSQSYGVVIKHDPAVFLALARDAGAPASQVSADVIGTTDDDQSAQILELEARRSALLGVSDPALVVLRDQCVAGIDARLTALAPQVAER